MKTGTSPGGRLRLAFAALAFTASCGRSGPTHIACIGDSITFGDGATASEHTYPGILQRRFGSSVRVGGYGHSGATALGPGRGNLPYESQPEYAEATSFVADAGFGAQVAVVILLGANDSKASNWDKPDQPAAFRRDILALVEHFEALPSHPSVYLATPLTVGARPCCGIRESVLTKEIGPILTSLGADHGERVIPLGDVLAGHPELLPDGVHPNDQGYELVADRIAQEILKHPPDRHWWLGYANWDL